MSGIGAALGGLVLLGALGGPALAADAPQAVARGKDIYAIRCSPCHGEGGAGDGPAAAAINPKPRNFHDPAFWRGRTPEQVKLVVKGGRPGTLMAPFEGVLSEDDIDGVVAYLFATFRPAPEPGH
jgi:mono/diheme cytochrome c family protein